MAIAPVNKFISVAVPVTPGEQLLYEVPTGTSAILLYAQVANVGINTYPTVTFIHRRETRSTGLRRDIRIINEMEIPPNDAGVLVDGRLVLEKTPLVLDRVYIKGNQTGIVTITDVQYSEPTGIITVTTMNAHGFSPGDPIAMAGIAFTCSSNAGVTTTIFPDPQQSQVVDTIVDVVGTSKTFTSVIGGTGPQSVEHFYNPSPHQFVKAKYNSIVTGGNYTHTWRRDTGTHTYTGGTIADAFTVTGAGGKGISNAVYDPLTGNLTLTSSNHNLTAGVNTIKIGEGKLAFTCDADAHGSTHYYPRTSDPAYDTALAISSTPDANTLVVNVGAVKGANSINVVSGAQNGTQKSPNSVSYDPTNGDLTIGFSANHNMSTNDNITIDGNSLTFTCSMDNNATEHTYPRSTDPTSGSNLPITVTSPSAFKVNVGASNFVYYTPTNATYDPFTGDMVVTIAPGYNLTGSTTTTCTTGTTYNPSTGKLKLKIASHGIKLGDKIRIKDKSLVFECDMDSRATQHEYPRPTDPDSNKWLPVAVVDNDNIEVTVSTSSNTSTHYWVSAESDAIEVSGESVRIVDDGLTFTCAMDGNSTEHAYPRSTDPAYSTAISIGATTINSITLQVGKATNAGGLVGPLQMEFVGSILENSTV